ncbi:hypothetical protein N8013_03190, partial [Algibacter sp.]|nr:hypothetical protein [Algibacter sp.]
YKDNEDITYYYLNYYFGEDNTILKGQTIISNNWKTIQHIFIYPLDDGTFREHYSNGSIKRQGDTITIKTNTLSGERYIDGASERYSTSARWRCTFSICYRWCNNSRSKFIKSGFIRFSFSRGC